MICCARINIRSSCRLPGKVCEEALSREIRSRYASRRPFRRRHRHGGGPAAFAGLRRGLGHGGRGGALRRDSGGLFRCRIRRHGNPDFRSHGADGHRHGGHHHHLCGKPDRSPHGGRDGRSPAGPPWRLEARPLRGLHALRGRIGLHVRHRRPRDGDSGPALFRLLTRAGRSRGHDSRTAGDAGQNQLERFGRRARHARRRGFLAAPIPENPAHAPRGAFRRHARGRLVAEGGARHRGGADRPAGAADRTPIARLSGSGGGARAHPRPHRLGGEPSHLPGGRFAYPHEPRPGPRTHRPGGGQRGRGLNRRTARRGHTRVYGA